MRLTAVLFFILFSSTFTFGQIIDRTEERAKQKANRRVDNKIDQGIDKGLDAIEGIFKKKDKPKKTEEKPKSEPTQPSKSQSEETDSGVFQKFLGGDVNVKDAYHYDQNILLGVQTIESNGKPGDEMEMRMYFSSGESSVGMEMTTQGVGTMIYDFENFQMVTLIDNGGQKIGMAMTLDPDLIEDEDDKNDNGEYKFVKTGKSKTISGYNCQEYKVESSKPGDDSEMFFWITKDINTDWMMSFSNAMNSNKSMSQSYKLPVGYPDGSVIQVVSASKKDKTQYITTVKEYNKNHKKTISTKGYQMMSMGGSE